MLTIRAGQLSAFEEARIPGFDDYMVHHLKDFTPLHAAAFGEEGSREFARLSIERAARYQFTKRGPVRFYAEMMILLGVDFDSDPQYPWASRILADMPFRDQLQKADRIWEKLMDFLNAVGGPDRSYARAALDRARLIPFQSISLNARDFDQQIIAKMMSIHPEKAAYVGHEQLSLLVDRARAVARSYGILTDQGVCFLAGMMYAIGHGCVEDPKYPWIKQTLTNPAIISPEVRVERLYSKTMTYLDNVLKHLAEEE